jgi:hypothetical protein
MTWEQLLKKVGEGKLPQVKVIETGKVGTVTVLKDNGRHRGVGVQFPGLNYDTWYHELNTGDRRSRYMDQLELVD